MTLGWDLTLGVHQLTHFESKMGKGNCGPGGWQKGIGAKLAVEQRPRGLAWVFPQDVSGMSERGNTKVINKKTQ